MDEQLLKFAEKHILNVKAKKCLQLNNRRHYNPF